MFPFQTTALKPDAGYCIFLVFLKPNTVQQSKIKAHLYGLLGCNAEEFGR
jgi:hypothetical protein